MSVDGWIKKPLGTVAVLNMGQSPDSISYTESEDDLPFLQGCADFQSRYPRAKIRCSQPKKRAEKDSILFSVRAPVGKINIADQVYIIGRGLASINGTVVHQSYLEHYLKKEEIAFQTASQGSTFTAINSSELGKWLINFPNDKKEQTKIAEILSTVDRAIEQTESLIAKQERIKTGLMQDLLTRGIDEHGNLRSEDTHEFKDSPLGRIPVEWEIVKIGDFCTVQGGFAFSSSEYSENGIRLLRISNISLDGLNMSDAVSLPSRYLKMFQKFLAKSGNIVIAMSGATTGKCCKISDNVLPCLINQRVGRFLIKAQAELNSDFLFAVINSTQIQTEVLIDSLGGAQQNVSPMEIESLFYAKPSFGEQNSIGEVLESFYNSMTDTQCQVRKFHSIKTALMQDLLTGEVKVASLLQAKEAIA